MLASVGKHWQAVQLHVQTQTCSLENGGPVNVFHQKSEEQSLLLNNMCWPRFFLPASLKKHDHVGIQRHVEEHESLELICHANVFHKKFKRDMAALKHNTNNLWSFGPGDMWREATRCVNYKYAHIKDK